MHYIHFLVFTPLFCSAGESLVHGPPEQDHGPERVLALAGRDVILPCSFNITVSRNFPTVEWSKKGIEPNVVFLYRDGCETYEMKNPDFEYRTNLVLKELKNGNISLRISNVQLSDAGSYQCMTLKKNYREITRVTLIVVAASEPELSVVSDENGEVTLQCEASCWLREPEITFLNDQGNVIPSKDPKRGQEASGCYTVRQRVTVKPTTGRVTCRVHQSNFNLSKERDIYITAASREQYWKEIAAFFASIAVIFICGFLVCLFQKRCCCTSEAQKLPLARLASAESTVVNTPENKLALEQRERSNNESNSSREQPMNQLAAHRPESTLQLLNSSSPSRSSPEVSSKSDAPKSAKSSQDKQRQSSHQGPSRPLQRTHRNKSSPALLCSSDTGPPNPSSAKTPEEKQGLIGRSMSMSHAQHNPHFARPPRRHSFGFQSSTLSNNRFSVLSDLKEESEPLVS